MQIQPDVHSIGFARRPVGRILVCAMAILLPVGTTCSSAGSVQGKSSGAALVDTASGIDDGSDGRNWPAYGRTYSEGHDSPLTEISDKTISRLGLVSITDLADVSGAATVPLAVNGVVYLAIGPSIVHAVDAASSKLLWQYDPQVFKVAGRRMRGVWGTRGLAYWHGRIYVGTYDGRLIALDARTGKPAWSVQTIGPNEENYITGAPRTFRGLVLIGNGGADSGNSRGYVTAYDARSGKQVWRFYLVPGNPAKGFEDDAMKMAAKTWTGEWWKFGGGGNAWNAITYDAELNLVYIGTGNGSPWNRNVRSPGGGDNLFLASIVALDADTGKYCWHYQINPGESWDYNAAMDIELATLSIDGKPRKVLMQAPKNGFFYVIDRETSKLISAEKFSKVTWASRIDSETGRPVENPGIHYENGPTTNFPGAFGAHGWMPMSFNRKAGLAFIPTSEMPSWYSDSTIDRRNWRPGPSTTNLATDGWDQTQRPESFGTSSLVAWDPVRQRKVWEVPTPGVYNGGTMTTAGNLVFHGLNDGNLVAYAADTGKELWRYDTGLAIGGAPITFLVGKRQYVAVVVGLGTGAMAGLGYQPGQLGWNAREIKHRLFLFALDGKAPKPVSQLRPRPPLVDDPDLMLRPDLISRGNKLYFQNCSACHGHAAVASGFAPDLRASPVRADPAAFNAVLHDGLLVERGMPRFEELSDEDQLALRHFIAKRVRDDLKR